MCVRAEINSIAVALIDNTWWIWWGDESGRVTRRDVTRHMKAPHHARDLSSTSAETIVSELIAMFALTKLETLFYRATVTTLKKELPQANAVTQRSSKRWRLSQRNHRKF